MDSTNIFKSQPMQANMNCLVSAQVWPHCMEKTCNIQSEYLITMYHNGYGNSQTLSTQSRLILLKYHITALDAKVFVHAVSIAKQKFCLFLSVLTSIFRFARCEIWLCICCTCSGYITLHIVQKCRILSFTIYAFIVMLMGQQQHWH